MFPRILLVLALCCLPAAARAVTVDEVLDSYLQIARTRVNSAPDATFPSPGAFHRRSVASDIEEFARRKRPIPPQDLENSVYRISAKVPSDSGLRRAGENLILTLTRDTAAKRANYRAEREALFLKAGQTCVQAKSEGDLVLIKQQLAKLHHDDQARPDPWNMDTSTMERTWRTMSFISTWQDFLRYRALGETSNASGQLGSLLFTIDLSIVPRSRLLELRSEINASYEKATSATARATADPRPLVSRLERVETLADLEELAPELKAMIENSMETDFRELARFSLTLVGKSLEPIKPRPHRAAFALEGDTGWNHPLARPNSHLSPRLRQVLFRLVQERRLAALQTAFTRPEEPPRENEPTEIYVLRIARSAAARDEWDQAVQILERYQTEVRNPGPAWIARELASCRNYDAARRHDDAGRIPEAIAAYRETLRAAGTLAPEKLVAERLSALRVSAPEAFAAASRLPGPVAPDARPPAFRQRPTPVLPPPARDEPTP